MESNQNSWDLRGHDAIEKWNMQKWARLLPLLFSREFAEV